ncbi:SH3 domain-binding protein 2-like [Dendronephthya gigantea]|uniref:SH3 domain-binding protein 2-like n=1 Tax=Dendronephthya gigantea TaxID=151771 RepID=UPI0010699499|nr:SH3 domain-binding protein 2-like [Dendronephthya gigantea]XP_028391425.1 SH3 domain-binding protein 2-like [Dendronephthya gigantea]XP_028391426.1 SH3 domain-binding protein 2-like [Dendronephthya gigantea]
MSSTKARSPSDPTPSTSHDGYGGGYPSHFQTLPARVPRDLRAAEPFPSIGAPALLGMDVSHTGWVRKEGYGYRSWKSRFMVLHHGCIYYFKETDSNGPKGKFSLNGYRCLLAPDREKRDRYPYVFKLVPDDEEHRTYYISSPSKSEMEGWMKSIDADIQLYCPSEYDYVDTTNLGDKSATCPTVPKNIPVVNRRGTETCPTPPDKITFPRSLPTSNIGKPVPLLPPKPRPIPSHENDEDGIYDDEKDPHYEPVDNSCFSSEGNYVAVLPNEIDLGNRAPDAYNGRPLPPIRPKPPPRPPEFNESSESEDEDSEEELYLDLIKANKKKHANRNGLSPSSPERERPIPSPRKPSIDEIDGVDVTYVSCIDVGNAAAKTNIPKPLPKPPPKTVPKPPPRTGKRHSQDPVEFDYLPPDCFQPDMDKKQAKVFLELGRTIGQYIINSSTTSDTKMSLSVWLGNGVKHYLLFKRQDMYTLDPSLSVDEHFTDLRQLVKYYYKHKLPKSDNYLKSPFGSK